MSKYILLIILTIIPIVSWILTVKAVKNGRIPIGWLIILCLNTGAFENIILHVCDTNKSLTEIIQLRDTIIEEQKEIIRILNEPKEEKKFYCTGTYYNPCASQCDESFLLTASNDSIDTVLLNKHKLKWVALSRDLMKDFSFDDTINVSSENYRINGEWIVKDVMNQRFTRHVDFLVPFNDTLQIGKCNIIISKKQ